MLAGALTLSLPLLSSLSPLRLAPLLVKLLLSNGHAFDGGNAKIPLDTAEQRSAIVAAQTAEDMYRVIK